MSLDKDIPNSFDLSSLRVIASGEQQFLEIFHIAAIVLTIKFQLVNV
jgi:protein involved in ribonucleotide reduction